MQPTFQRRSYQHKKELKTFYVKMFHLDGLIRHTSF